MSLIVGVESLGDVRRFPHSRQVGFVERLICLAHVDGFERHLLGIANLDRVSPPVRVPHDDRTGDAVELRSGLESGHRDLGARFERPSLLGE